MKRLHAILSGCFLAIGPCLAAQCTLCQDGSEVPLKEKGLGRDNDAIPIKTCGELEMAVSGMAETMANCQSARSQSSFCGCPLSETACRLCDDLYVSSIQALQETTIDAKAYIVDSPSTNMTCQSVESFLHSIPNNDEEGVCAEVKGSASAACCSDAVPERVTGATEPPEPTEAPEGSESSSIMIATHAALLVASCVLWGML